MNKFEYKKLTPFKWFVLENFPFIEADFDALTDWQLFCKLGKEINKILNSTNALGTQVETLTEYVSNYFENLDVQNEINNKLDEMAQNGELQEIITQYIQMQGLLMYNNIQDMKNATNIVNNSFLRTLGYYNKNDGGGSFYKVREVKNTDTIDNKFLIALNNISLVAELVVDTEINIKQVGAKTIDEDNSFDNTEIIQKAIDYINSKNGGNVLIPSGTFKVSGTLKLKEYVNIIGQGNSSRTSEKATTIFHNPSTSTNLFENEDVTDDNYKGYYSIKNICLYGNRVSNIALDLKNTSNSSFEKLNILYFNKGIRINFGMLNVFRDINILYFREYGILIDNNGITTRQLFENCYIGQTTFSNTAIPLYICRKAVIDTTFKHCTFESCNDGIYISPENHIEFENLYTENLPAVEKPTFNFGILNDETNISSSNIDNTVVPGQYTLWGQIHIVGAFIQGSPTVSHTATNKFMINAGYCDIISISNAKIRSFNRLYNTLENVKNKLMFENCITEVIGTADFVNYAEHLQTFNCRSNDNLKNYNAFDNFMEYNRSVANINTPGWYRVAKLTNTVTYATASLLTITTSYANNPPVAMIVSVCTSSSSGSIKILDSVGGSNQVITQVRVTSGSNNEKYVEVYYNKSTANDVTAQMINSTSEKRAVTPTVVTDNPTVLQTATVS